MADTYNRATHNAMVDDMKKFAKDFYKKFREQQIKENKLITKLQDYKLQTLHMSLEQTVMAEMKDAMKAKNEAALRGLRAIKAEIIKAKTEPGANGQISEDTELKCCRKW